MVAVGVIPVLGPLTGLAGVVNDGDGVSRPVGDPQVVSLSRVELKVSGLIQRVRGGGDDGLIESGTKLLYDGILGAGMAISRVGDHRSCQRNCGSQHEQGQDDTT